MPISSRERDLRVRLQFLADLRDWERAKNSAKELAAELQRTQGLSRGEAFKQALAQQADATRPITREIATLNVELEELERKRETLSRAYTQLSRLSEISRQLGAAGAAILGPLVLLATQYQKVSSLAVESTLRWTQATDRLRNAQLRIGQAAQATLLPFMERAGLLAEDAARLIERHPEIIKLAAGAGVALTAVGAVGLVTAEVAQAVIAVKDIATLIAPLIQSAGGLIQLAASAGVLGLGVGIIGGAGFLALQEIGRRRGQTTGEVVQDVGQTIKQLFTLAGTLLNRSVLEFVNGLHKARAGLNNLVTAIGSLLYEVTGGVAGFSPAVAQARRNATQGELDQAIATNQAYFDAVLRAAIDRVIGGPGGGAGDAEQFLGPLTDDLLRSFEDYLIAADRAQAAHVQARKQQQDDFDRSQIEAAREFGRTLDKLHEDFNRQREKAEQAHLRALARLEANRGDALASARDDANEREIEREQEYQRQAQQHADDYQRERLRALEDHQEKLRDAAGRLDAVAVLAELRRFAKDERQSGEDYALEEQRRAEARQRESQEAKKDLQQRLQDINDSYDKQRQLAIENYAESERLAKEDFERQRQQMIEEFNYQQELRRQHFEEQLRREDAQFRREMALKDRHYIEDLNRRLYWQGQERELQAQHLDALRQQLLNFIGQTEAAASTAFGGITQGPVIQTGVNGTVVVNGETLINPYTGQPYVGGLGGFQLGGMVGRTGPAMLHRGEQVIPAAAAERMRSMMGGNINPQLLKELVGRSLSMGDMVVNDVGNVDGLRQAVRLEFEALLDEMGG